VDKIHWALRPGCYFTSKVLGCINIIINIINIINSIININT